MKKLDPKLFSKVEIVAENVLRNLKKKGYVVPSLLENNTINFDGFIVGRDRDDLYFVKHVNREIKIPRINLPQTAALLANSLALGKNADEKFESLIDNSVLNWMNGLRKRVPNGK